MSPHADHAELASSASPASFEDILDELESLAREHLLFYRVQVGSVLLEHFWGGDSCAFSSHDPTKNSRFEQFFEKCAEALVRYGLSRRQARDSVRAAIVVHSLPPAIAEQLFLTQVLLLTRLRDPTTRARVANAAIVNDWSVKQLKLAVAAARAGLPLDSDPEEPGVQIPEVKLDARKPAPGRLVTRVEKLATEVELWSTQWAQVDGGRGLWAAQRARLATAADRLELQVTELRRVIAAGQTK